MDNVSDKPQAELANHASGALQRVWPTALAVMPIGMLFGVLARQAGWGPLDVFSVSLFGFSGSGQFALLPLAGQGVGFFTMLLVAVSINCRYVPIAFVAAARLPRRFLPRLCLAHTLGDEAYAIEKDSDPVRDVLVIRMAILGAWVISTLGGVLAAGLIPAGLVDPAVNLGFPASVVLLYLSFSQLRQRLAGMRGRYLRRAAGVGLCIVVAGSAIALFGPIYFWIPSIALCTWIVWKVQA